MNARTRLPYSPLMSPQQWRQQAASNRFRTWRDQFGGEWSEDFFVYRFAMGNIAAGAAAVQNLTVQADSAFEAMFITASDANGDEQAINCTLQLTDGGTSRNFFDNPVPIPLLCGSGPYQHVLPVPRRFAPRATITAALYNFDSATAFNSVEIDLHGRKIIPENSIARARAALNSFLKNSWRANNGVLYAEDYFGYVQNVGTVANAAVNNTITNIIPDSDFELINMMSCAFANVITGAIKAPAIGVSMQLQDIGTGRNLLSTAALSEALTGWGGRPFVLPVPRIFKAKTQFQVTYTNNAGAAVNSLYTLFEGRKIFELSE